MTNQSSSVFHYSQKRVWEWRAIPGNDHSLQQVWWISSSNIFSRTRGCSFFRPLRSGTAFPRRTTHPNKFNWARPAAAAARARRQSELSERNNSSPKFGVTNRSHSVDGSQSLTLPARQQRDTSQSYSESDQKDNPYKIFCPCGVALTPAEEERFKCLNSIAARQHEEEEAVRQVRLAAPPDRRGRRPNVPPKGELRVPRLYRIALEDLRRDTACRCSSRRCASSCRPAHFFPGAPRSASLRCFARRPRRHFRLQNQSMRCTRGSWANLSHGSNVCFSSRILCLYIHTYIHTYIYSHRRSVKNKTGGGPKRVK